MRGETNQPRTGSTSEKTACCRTESILQAIELAMQRSAAFSRIASRLFLPSKQ